MVVQVLQESSNEELNDLEKFYIEKYNCLSPNGMNCTTGGDSGRMYSEEYRIKLSKSHRKKNLGSIRKCPSGKFDASVKIMGKTYHVGMFDSREEAQIGIDSFYAKYDPHYTNYRPPTKNAARGMGCVYQNKQSGKYGATIMHQGKNYYCGYHATEFEAHEALKKFKNEFNPDTPPKPIIRPRGTGSISYHKRIGKYVAKISHNKIHHHCGAFGTEAEAESALALFDPMNPPPRKRKKGGSVSYDKRAGKYRAKIFQNGKEHYCGRFPTEAAAHEALEKFKASLDVTTPAPTTPAPIAPNIAND
jgi:hypothetical protein